ncbi:unnamed protein product [Chilo suppressalis]|uniref:Peptidase M14 domain-containing protein n=1 Tax=Chilo suppressalis TaxID=168631 RepID=A0ABN8EA78_CHISP|nr:unnamed protein product [Chilo suppressalis]
MKIILCFVIIASVAKTNAEYKNYLGYKLYKAVPTSEDHVNLLLKIQNSGIGEFWTDYYRVGDDVRIMVSPKNEESFLSQLKESKLEAKSIFEDLQQIIDTQNPPANVRNVRSTESFHSMTWDRYYDLEAINTWLDELAAAYPKVVTTVVMGTSVENREIKGIKIDYHPEQTDKKIGFLEGTLHAREWISPATITWIVKEFLTSTDSDVRAFAENLEWHVFPVVNPDGYVYTFTDHRLWRKNRSQANFTTCATNVNDDMSNGVDLNRNFDFVWMTVGASNDPCSNTFAGPSAASEPETRAIQQYMTNLSNHGEIIYYLSFHSYTQLFIVPYSHITTNQVLTANNYANMYEIAIRSAEKVSQRYGTHYRVGISAEVLYPMSGSSFDWVKNHTDAKVSFLIELRDLGEFGFLLPASQIIPNNLEVMDGLIEMDKTTKKLGYYHSRSGSSTILQSVIVVLLGLFVSIVL